MDEVNPGALGGDGRRPAGAEVFEEWLSDMHPKLAGLEDLFLPGDFPFDYSRESLGRLEGILLATFADRAAVFAPADRDFLDRCVRYIGETLIRNFRGEWRYSTDPEFVYTGVPFVVNEDGTGIPIAPLYSITSLVERRTGSELVRLYDGIKPDYDAYQAAKPQERKEREAAEAARASRPRTSDAAQAFLDRWQADMSTKLAAWANEFMPPGFRLDFTRDSLFQVENVLLERIAGEDEVDRPENADFVEGIVRYLGETIVRAGFGYWHYQDWGDDAPKSNIYHRVPYVNTHVEPHEQAYTCVPLWSIQAAAGERTGEILAEDFDSAKEDIEAYRAGTS